jgi:class 3 adenylate cyclase
MFSDIVGFTTISSKMSPTKVSDLLDRLFRKFDALAQAHGIQRVDIIGDAYMAATNLLEDQAGDHAARLARFALDAVAAARSTRIDDDAPDSPSVAIRVGLHCGPVSACVLGAHAGKYTLVGDTVNVASRMESASIPGHVQCSEAAAALIALQSRDIPLHPRAGGALVKGKGHMRTYWVGATAPQAPRAHFRLPLPIDPAQRPQPAWAFTATPFRNGPAAGFGPGGPATGPEDSDRCPVDVLRRGAAALPPLCFARTRTRSARASF